MNWARLFLVLLAVTVWIGCGADQGRDDPGGDTAADAAAGAGTTEPTSEPGEFSGSDTLWSFEGSLGVPVATFGDPPEWTPTTIKAGNRGTTGGQKTVIGEVVDVSCYLQLGKRGEAHVPCGTNCVQNGAPIGLVDGNNNLYIVMAEEHDPRRYGNVALKEAMLPFMAKTVQVAGMVTEREGVRTLYVLGYTIGENPNKPGN